MNFIRKTIIFSQVGKPFGSSGIISGLLHIESREDGKDGVRTVFSDLPPSSADDWSLVLRCGEKFVMSGITLPEDYFVTEKLDCSIRTEALLVIEKEGEKLPVAYACSSGGNKDAFITKALSILKEKRCFYREKSTELIKVFSDNKPFPPLIKAFRESYWVKIPRGEAFFAQGMILSSGKPLYICFAMPEKYMKKQDDIFVYFAPEGKRGYFLAFQDAFSGKAVKPDVTSLLRSQA